MKIIDVETILLNNNEPYRGGRYWLFIKLITDEGIVGLGERPTGHALDLSSQISLIRQICDEFVIGNSPFDIEKMWQRVYGTRHDYRHPSLYGTPALSAIEMACWDIVGKALNQPIYNLLGGQVHDKLRAYAYMPTDGIWENPEKAGEIAAKLVEDGNTACKFDPFTPFVPAPRDYSLKFIRHVGKIFQAIRDEVGDELEVAIGTHGQFRGHLNILCQPVEHSRNRSSVNDSLAALGAAFIIFAKAAIAVQPSQSTFDNPTDGNDNKALRIRRSRSNF